MEYKIIRKKDIVIEDYDNKKDKIGQSLDLLDLNWFASKEEIKTIKELAIEIKTEADVLLVLGIGGSYLGSKAVIEAISPYFYNDSNKIKIYYLGTSLSDKYLTDLFEMIKDKSIYVDVVSKSGNTLEIELAYKLVIRFMKNKYNDDEIKNRVIITTNSDKGFLRKEINSRGYRSLVISSSVSGRYSLFTSAGLLPMAVANIDIDDLINGAKSDAFILDRAYQYAYNRNFLYQEGKTVEVLTSYEPKLYYLLEWIKQLQAETLGKNNQGILPISAIYTQDLHSVEQFIIQGNPIVFQTFVKTEPMNKVNNVVFESILQVRQKSNITVNIINVGELNEYDLGNFLQFMMLSTVVSAIIDGVNPFDQPGVENYKKVINSKLKKEA